MRRDGMGYEYCDEEYDDIRVTESPKQKRARIFEKEQQAATKREKEKIWEEQQKIS